LADRFLDGEVWNHRHDGACGSLCIDPRRIKRLGRLLDLPLSWLGQIILLLLAA
jgi:hypothetical protein